MRVFLPALAVSFALLMLTGCATTTVKHYAVDSVGPINNPEERADHGVRYYENAPFILVYIGGDAGDADADSKAAGEPKKVFTTQVVWLPDTTTVFTAKPVSALGVNKTTLEFENGVLTKGSAYTDTTAVPKALITMAKDMALRTTEAAKGPSGPPDEKVFLYRVGQDPATGRPCLHEASLEATILEDN